MTRYRTAFQSFRFRYLLAAVLRNDGRVVDAAREAGVHPKFVWQVLRQAGVKQADIRKMLVNRELLKIGLPPRKPVASAGVADQGSRRSA